MYFWIVAKKKRKKKNEKKNERKAGLDSSENILIDLSTNNVLTMQSHMMYYVNLLLKLIAGFDFKT